MYLCVCYMCACGLASACAWVCAVRYPYEPLQQGHTVVDGRAVLLTARWLQGAC